MTFSHRIFQFLKALTAILFCGFFPVQLLAVDVPATMTITTSNAGDLLSSAIFHDISRDGKVVVGNHNGSALHFALADSAPTGTITALPSTLGQTSSGAYATNQDGSVIVGWAHNIHGRKKAFRLETTPNNPSNAGMQNLSSASPNDSEALNVSADGNVVVGWSHKADWSENAFRWRADIGMQELDMSSILYNPAYYSEINKKSRALAASEDGKSIVGYVRTVGVNGNLVQGTTFPTHKQTSIERELLAFFWREDPFDNTKGTVYTLTNTIGNIEDQSVAYDISSDGKVIVGWAYNRALGNDRAFRWVLADATDPHSSAGMENLGAINLTLGSRAYGVNGDGTVIVGQTINSLNISIGFRWEEGGGIEYVGNWLIRKGINPADVYNLNDAIAVSNDGNTIIGTEYIARFVPTSTIVSPPPVDPVDPPPTTITNPAPNAGQAAAISMSASREASFFIASGLLYALANDAFDGFFLPPFCDDEDENNKRHASIHLLGQLDKEKEDCFNASRHSNGAYQLSFNHQSSQGLSYGLGFNVGKTQHQLANLAFNSSANRPEFSAHIRTPILPNTYLTLSANQHDRAYQIHRHSIKGVENAHGSLSAQGQTYNALLTHPFSIGDIRFSPMLGLSYQQLNISAYDERTSRAVFPFHLSAGHNNVMRAQAGIQAKVALSQLTKLSLKFNALQDIHRDISPINASAGGFTMLSNFDPNAVLDDQDYATALNLNFTHRVDQHHRLGFNVELKNPFYQQGNEFQVSLEQVIEF